MNSPENNKDYRRQKFLSKSKLNNKKNEYSEEQRFMSKSKKELKRKLQDIKGEELWEDWDNPEN